MRNENVFSAQISETHFQRSQIPATALTNSAHSAPLTPTSFRSFAHSSLAHSSHLLFFALCFSLYVASFFPFCGVPGFMYRNYMLLTEYQFTPPPLTVRSPEIDSASLCSLTGRYDNPILTRFLAHIDCLKIPAQILSRSTFLFPNFNQLIQEHGKSMIF